MTRAVAQIRVLLAMQSAHLRRAYKHLLGSDGQLDVIAEAADGCSAVARVRQTAPHVAVIDFHFADSCGLRAVADITLHAPATRVIVLSDDDGDEYQRAAREAGAIACIKKTCFAALIETIRGTRVGSRQRT
ncbi:MAG: response regulator transcription factor [Chloroflexi bacterium]|nr:response regulator transcription factor [Chloroflexota bacterium]